MAPKVLLDTTTLCAAMRNPGGSGMKLLRLGLLGLFEPIVTEEIIAEWVRNCRKGLGQGKLKVTFSESGSAWGAANPGAGLSPFKVSRAAMAPLPAARA